jgi:formylglycine-generating enzyme required for sulfatase activity
MNAPANLRPSKQVREKMKPPGLAPYEHMAWIPGGTFLMGSNDHYPEEAPAHYATVEAFWMDKAPVTNEQFNRFIEATGYLTVAERPLNPDDYPGAKPEMLAPGSIVFKKPPGRVDLRNHFDWWTYALGASWRHPMGPGSSLKKGMARHPVAHIAYEDAEAYARWAGKELPTEAEWEYAARGGLEGAAYTWGNEFAPNGKMMANTWQGEFPVVNLLTDGYERTSPIGSFPPNGYGLYDMAGNVWEWTTDWYQERGKIANSCCANFNPKGGEKEASIDSRTPEIRIPRKVLKGGSYLCAPNYCLRYRPAARIAQQIDSGTCHQGFRCIVRA